MADGEISAKGVLAALERIRARNAADPDHEAKCARHAAGLKRASLLRDAADRCVPLPDDTAPLLLDPSLSGELLEAVREALRWRGARGRRSYLFFALLGNAGVGKTVALSHAVLHAECSALYASAAVVARTAPPRFPSEEDKSPWRRWREVNLLAIDEVGLESDPGAIVTLILERWEHGRATVVAGNFSGEDFARRYFDTPQGDRLADRVKGQVAEGQSWVVISDAESLRGRLSSTTEGE